jgi:hypothetical protein
MIGTSKIITMLIINGETDSLLFLYSKILIIKLVISAITESNEKNINKKNGIENG